MRRSILLVPVLLALTVGVAAADSVIGFGLAYGLASPTGGQWSDTKESKSGINMAWRIPMALGKMFSLEPFMERTEGDADSMYVGTLDGYDVMSYGANVGLGRLVRNSGGLHLTPFVGGCSPSRGVPAVPPTTSSPGRPASRSASTVPRPRTGISAARTSPSPR